jgi:hypothetical protein
LFNNGETSTYEDMIARSLKMIAGAR